MQTIVEGNPGSGKSYFFVNYLMKYCTFDPLYQEHIVREDVLIISNVDGLKIKHKSLDVLLEKYGPVEKFFTVENFEAIQKQYKVKNIILGIDEAQRIFDSKFYNTDVFYFFQYHRHLGVDIFLITQSRSTLARQLLPLCEYFIQAKPRSKVVKGTFTYNYLDPKGQYMYNKTLRCSQDVFRAYKSMDVDEVNKPRNVLKYYAIMGLVAIAGTFFLFKSFFGWFKADSKKDVQAAKKVSRNVPSSVPSSLPAASPVSAPVSAPAVAAVAPSVKHSSVKRPRKKPLSVGGGGALPSPPPADTAFERVKVSQYIDTGVKRHVVVNGKRIQDYQDFDIEDMTALVPVKNKI